MIAKCLFLMLALIALPGLREASGVTSTTFGTLADGRTVGRHILVNRRGMTVELTDRGAAITRIALPGRAGTLDEMVVGPATLDELARSNRRFGAIVGRYSGRLRGEVTIDGRRHRLATNASGVTLHGGDPGFDRALWRARRFATRDAVGVEFTHVSPDGDQGLPGTLTVTARYSLARDADALSLDITATSDRLTVANLTNHVYFDLSGGRGLGCQTLQVDARRRVALDMRKLPIGALAPFADFAAPKRLEGVVAGGGIDEMLVLDGTRTVRLTDLPSGRTLALTTDQPGLQVFTGNSFDGSDRDRAGRPIGRFGGIALEPQHFPDSPAIAHFPSTRISPGRPLTWHARWSFARGRSRPCR